MDIIDDEEIMKKPSRLNADSSDEEDVEESKVKDNQNPYLMLILQQKKQKR